MTFEEIARRSEVLAGKRLCPFCRMELRFHDSEISRWPSLKPLAYINNVTLKCAECKFLARFGIQVKKAWFDKAVELRGGVKTISIFDRYFERDDETQRKRLKALGYI